MSSTEHNVSLYDIAIIGLVGRFPGAENVGQFWENISNGVENITFFSDEELQAAGIQPARWQHSNYVKARGMIPDIEYFDATFFDYSPREAEMMDPQHRLFLECAWQALEQAGYDSERYGGRIGVFAGAGINAYLLNNFSQHIQASQTAGAFQSLISHGREFLATRVSYKLNLKGPSLTIQTACSTSLVAVHLACQSILNHECDMALAGGITLSVPETAGYLYEPAGIFSPDGHCRPFSADAKGTVSGSGVGVVVLKLLTAALKDGDTIHAVVKGSAINNDGARKIGYTAPSEVGQFEVITEALAMADVVPDTIGYVEAHGTGTPLGDPIEVAALTQAFRTGTTKRGFCALGSVKSNIGHLDAAAGIAGFIKTVLALKHKQLPPSLHFSQPNPQIDFAGSPFYVNTEPKEWHSPKHPRRAGVSSFGIGGTNAHVVLEEAPAPIPSDTRDGAQIFVLSARNETSLVKNSENLACTLRQNPSCNLADVAYTLQVGRHHFPYRHFVVGQQAVDIAGNLENFDPHGATSAVAPDIQCSLFFMFPGQGSHHIHMAGGLYETEPVFRQSVDQCVALLEPHLGFDLLDILYPKADQVALANEKLNQIAITLPALFAIEYSLARLWQSWGLQPDALIGYSFGEYVAACLAGVFSLEDGAALIAHRSRLLQKLPPGAMLSVALSLADLSPWLANTPLAIAGINGPDLCLVSGPNAAIDRLQSELGKHEIGVRRLRTEHAYHSQMTEGILDEFAAYLKNIALHPPQIPFVANVSGTWITDEQATDPGYWVQHLRQTVRFAEGVQTLLSSDEQALFLEIGPGHTLSTFARQQPGTTALMSLPHPQEDQPDHPFILTTLGHLWLHGQEIDWPTLHRGQRRRRVPLPTYAFTRERYWLDTSVNAHQSTTDNEQVKPVGMADWFYMPVWKSAMMPNPAQDPAADCWLLFSNGDAFSEQLQRYLKRRGQQVLTVSRGTELILNDSTYVLRPDQPADYQTLFATLEAGGLRPGYIVYLWNLSPMETTSTEEYDEHLLESFYSPLFLAQALGLQDQERKIQLAFVTNHMQRVWGTDVVYPEKATVLGPGKIISQEMPHVASRIIDVAVPAAGEDGLDELFGQLVRELNGNGQEAVVAYRANSRWVQAYESVRLAEVTDVNRWPLREQGVYLITGGLGGIGLALADYLARTVQARLVLTTRTTFPAAEKWEMWLATHDPHDNTSVRIRALQALKALNGSDVLVWQADVTEIEQMQTAVQATQARFGTIHGVIHAAGLPGGGVIQLKSKEAAASVLKPKVQGTRVLEEVLVDIPLDFMVLCSSTAVPIGGVGLVDYCAANAFLDAYAQAQFKQSATKVISINWGRWAEMGMAINTPWDYSLSLHTPQYVTTAVAHPLIENAYQNEEKQTIFQMALSPTREWLSPDAISQDIALLPSMLSIELMAATVVDVTQAFTPINFESIEFLSPLIVGKGERKEARLLLQEDAQGFVVRFQSLAGKAGNGQQLWQSNARGKLRGELQEKPAVSDIQAISDRCRPSDEAAINRWLQQEHGLFSPPLRQLKVGQQEALALLSLEDEASPYAKLAMNPTLLYAAIHGTMAACGYPLSPNNLVSLQQVQIYTHLPATLYCHTRLYPKQDEGQTQPRCQIVLLHENGEVALIMEAVAGKQPPQPEKNAFKDLQTTADPDQLILGERYQHDFSQAIPPSEGAQACHRVLAHGHWPQIAVTARHLPAQIRRTHQLTKERIQEIASTMTSTTATLHKRPNLPTTFLAPRNEIEEQLVAIWQRLLGITEIGVHDNFFALGGHSLMATQLISQVKKQFDIELSIQTTFENQTVAELALAVGAAQLGDIEDWQELGEQLADIQSLSAEELQQLLQSKEELQ